MTATRLMRKYVAAPLALALFCAGMASAATEAEFQIRFTDESTAEMESVQMWRDQEARDFRALLDRGLGNGDGTLSQDEVDTILNATQRDLQGIQNPNLQLDGTPARLQGVNVSAEGLAGPVDQAGTILLRHTVNLTFPQNETGAAQNDTATAASHTVTFTPFVSGTTLISAPPGWQIQDAQGFAGTPQNTGDMVKGTATEGQAINLTFVPGDTGTGTGNNTGDGNNTNPDEVGFEGNDTPAPGFAAVVAALGAVALLVVRRRE